MNCPHCHQPLYVEFYRPRIYCQACGGCSAIHMNSLVPIWQEGPPPIIQAVQNPMSAYIPKRKKRSWGWMVMCMAWIIGGVAGIFAGLWILNNFLNEPLHIDGLRGILGVDKDAGE